MCQPLQFHREVGRDMEVLSNAKLDHLGFVAGFAKEMR
jgi:hypothetical protein